MQEALEFDILPLLAVATLHVRRRELAHSAVPLRDELHRELLQLCILPLHGVVSLEQYRQDRRVRDELDVVQPLAELPEPIDPPAHLLALGVVARQGAPELPAKALEVVPLGVVLARNDHAQCVVRLCLGTLSCTRSKVELHVPDRPVTELRRPLDVPIRVHDELPPALGHVFRPLLRPVPCGERYRRPAHHWEKKVEQRLECDVPLATTDGSVLRLAHAVGQRYLARLVDLRDITVDLGLHRLRVGDELVLLMDREPRTHSDPQQPVALFIVRDRGGRHCQGARGPERHLDAVGVALHPRVVQHVDLIHDEERRVRELQHALLDTSTPPVAHLGQVLHRHDYKGYRGVDHWAFLGDHSDQPLPPGEPPLDLIIECRHNLCLGHPNYPLDAPVILGVLERVHDRDQALTQARVERDEVATRAHRRVGTLHAQLIVQLHLVLAGLVGAFLLERVEEDLVKRCELARCTLDPRLASLEQVVSDPLLQCTEKPGVGHPKPGQLVGRQGPGHNVRQCQEALVCQWVDWDGHEVVVARRPRHLCHGELDLVVLLPGEDKHPHGYRAVDFGERCVNLLPCISGDHPRAPPSVECGDHRLGALQPSARREGHFLAVDILRVGRGFLCLGVIPRDHGDAPFAVQLPPLGGVVARVGVAAQDR